jgi:hypothetical protein
MFIPTFATFPFILLTYTFAYTFQFLLMITAQNKQEMNTLIGAQISKLHKPFPWLGGYYALQCTSQQGYSTHIILLVPLNVPSCLLFKNPLPHQIRQISQVLIPGIGIHCTQDAFPLLTGQLQ